jgi:hypothetical protein
MFFKASSRASKVPVGETGRTGAVIWNNVSLSVVDGIPD